ncbi:hypothetical protein TNCV_3926711 [Trichonephila clavipes]|nr:hypothetical protein TNCV_3926711 [Trichonephila clavipes]
MEDLHDSMGVGETQYRECVSEGSANFLQYLGYPQFEPPVAHSSNRSEIKFSMETNNNMERLPSQEETARNVNGKTFPMTLRHIADVRSIIPESGDCCHCCDETRLGKTSIKTLERISKVYDESTMVRFKNDIGVLKMAENPSKTMNMLDDLRLHKA